MGVDAVGAAVRSIHWHQRKRRTDRATRQYHLKQIGLGWRSCWGLRAELLGPEAEEPQRAGSVEPEGRQSRPEAGRQLLRSRLQRQPAVEVVGLGQRPEHRLVLERLPLS